MVNTSDIVRIKISLDAVKPIVMRRIELLVSTRLDTLHEIIQAIMPWGNYHSYEFRVRESRWGIPMPDIDDFFGYPIGDACETPLSRALSEPNFKTLRYTYDFGDDWRHTIKVEQRFSAELWDEFPRLVDCKGRCPPEDIGGPWGYAEYLEAISDPVHPRHDEFIAWLGRRDAGVIDRAAIETALSHFVKRSKNRRRANREI